MTAFQSVPPSEPIVDLIDAYSRGIAIYNAASEFNDNDTDNALAASTFDGPLRHLRSNPPRPRTMQGAIAALKHLREQMASESLGESEDLPLLDAVIAYFTDN